MLALSTVLADVANYPWVGRTTQVDMATTRNGRQTAQAPASKDERDRLNQRRFKNYRGFASLKKPAEESDVVKMKVIVSLDTIKRHAKQYGKDKQKR